MTLTLETVYAAATDLLKRFDLQPTFNASWGKFLEESHEMNEKLFELSEYPNNADTREDTAEEMADVLVTLSNVLYTEHIPVPALYAFVSSFTEKYELLSVDTLTPRQCAIEFSALTYDLHTALIMTRFGTEKYQRVNMVMPVFNRLMSAFVRQAKKAGVTLEDLEAGVKAVADKNAKKNHDTHEVRNGMICRKPQENAS